ncbi:MAG: EAL domain-containing protein [Dokdonella sp.]
MATRCGGCRDSESFGLSITMAFQPIVDVRSHSVHAYEALVRGVEGLGAPQVLSRVSEDNRYAFDQQCRIRAIELAASLEMASRGASVSINFMPNAVYEPRACIRQTLMAAEKTGFPLDRIIFEFTENEALDPRHVLGILRAYREIGFKTAIDDFGAGYAGLGLLASFQPDLVKLDMALIRDIDSNAIKRTIVRNTLQLLRDLGITPICEGVESKAEFDVLLDLGVVFMQGYLFARPQVARLPDVAWPVG